MTESDSIDRALLCAKSGLSPDDFDRARVLGHLESRYPELAPAAMRPPGTEQVARAGFWQAVRATGAGGAALGMSLVAAGFAIGYGSRPPATEALDVRLPRAAVVAPSAPGPAAPAPPAYEPAETRAPASRKSDVTEASTDGLALKRTPASRPPLEAASDEARNQLERELHWLQRAERALRSGDARLALALLAELDAEYRRPLLGEERAATRHMAACQLSQPGAA